MRRRRFACCVLVALGYSLAGAAAQSGDSRPVLVVAAHSPVRTLTPEQVRALFLGQVVEVREGVRLMPLDFDDGGALQHDFYQAHLGRTLNRMRAHWSRIVFAQEGRPPPLLRSGDELRRFLEGQPLAVGYVPAEGIPAGLRVVAR